MAVGDQGAAPAKGGIPMWAIIGAGAALGLFLYMRRRAAADGATSSPLVPAVVTDPNTGLPVDPLTGLPYVTNPQGPATNETWYSGAMQWASTHGISPSLANSALYKYINGQLLNANEAGVIDKVLGQFGAPPSPLPFGGTPVLPKPTPTGPTLPAIRGAFPEYISTAQHKLIPVAPGSTFLDPHIPLYGLQAIKPYGMFYSTHTARDAALYNQTRYTFPEFAQYIVPPAKAA
jgi:hypothetical protein